MLDYQEQKISSNIFKKFIINYCKNKRTDKSGERSQVVKAMGCGSVTRGFDSRRSPSILFRSLFKLIFNNLFLNIIKTGDFL